jgi:hypothetical protein
MARSAASVGKDQEVSCLKPRLVIFGPGTGGGGVFLHAGIDGLLGHGHAGKDERNEPGQQSSKPLFPNFPVPKAAVTITLAACAYPMHRIASTLPVEEAFQLSSFRSWCTSN